MQYQILQKMIREIRRNHRCFKQNYRNVLLIGQIIQGLKIKAFIASILQVLIREAAVSRTCNRYKMTNIFLGLQIMSVFWKSLIKSMRKFISKNPYTGQLIKQVDFLTDAQLDEKIVKAQKARKRMLDWSIPKKAGFLKNLASVLEQGHRRYAQIITAEVGKSITTSMDEVDLAIGHAKYCAENLQEFLKPTRIAKSHSRVGTTIKYEPLGTIFYIVPFNYPFWHSFKGAVPTLMLGNPILSRPADSCPMVGEAVQEIFDKAGMGNGQFQVLYSTQKQTDRIMSSPTVAGVGFTGSSKAGSIIAQIAAKHIKKSVMELGGNDAFIVLPDADVHKAVKDAVRGRCTNSGQICFSPKRCILVGNTFEKFRDWLIEQLKKVRIGDPMDQKTQVGPLAREDLYSGLEEQLKRVPKSWKTLWQSDCKRPFFPITVLQGEANEPFYEEMFGPVFSLIQAKDAEHAIEIANQGEYGLGATVYSKDIDKAQEILKRVRSGMCFINEVPKCEPSFPAGGVGHSGYGRECGLPGFREFANERAYYIN